MLKYLFLVCVLCGLCFAVVAASESAGEKGEKPPHGTLDLLHGLGDVRYFGAVTDRDWLIAD